MQNRNTVAMGADFESKGPLELVFFDLYPVHYQFTRPVILEVARFRDVKLIVTTNRHVAVEGGALRFAFKGKSGQTRWIG